MSTTLRHLPTAVRFALGALFFIFGLDGFLHFAPHPPMNPAGGQFMGALLATGYMLPLIKGTEVVAGALLLTGRYVPLALTLLAPVIVNIALFHTLLQPMFPIVLFVLSAEVFLAYVYRASFAGVLNGGAQPTWASQRKSAAGLEMSRPAHS